MAARISANCKRAKQGGVAEPFQTDTGKNPFVSRAAHEEGLHVLFSKIGFGKAGIPKKGLHRRERRGLCADKQRSDQRIGRFLGHGAALSSRRPCL
ncbi:hypothetical protein APR52_37310 [Variovorax paradoxus]|nr:hypothetical protein APR52_37310 [Variovorax paradoxus]